ncbi:MAG: hypothetical protein J5I90_10005 [Caldilineales bacterium]|nr:hypothetical protein [Caldilineales bacterium]
MTTLSTTPSAEQNSGRAQGSGRRMSTWLKVLIGLLLFFVFVWLIYHFVIKTSINRWGATEAEVSAVLPGDELVPHPASIVTRAISIQAAPEHIFPWLLQMGANKGGLYSYDWLETNLLRCRLVNADRIHPEWQDLKVGDKVEMCPDQAMPPPYTVSMINPNEALIMGHQENGEWVNQWQFVLLPQADGNTRLVLRTRTNSVGGFWDIIHPGVFIMERGMLLGVKERAESLAAINRQ